MLNGLKFSESLLPVINIKVHLFFALCQSYHTVHNLLVRFHQFGSVVLDLINILNLGKFNLRTLGS